MVSVVKVGVAPSGPSRAERVCVPLFVEDRTVPSSLPVDPALRESIAAALERKAFRGEPGEVLPIPGPRGARVHVAYLLGLGPRAKCSQEALRKALGSFSRRARKEKLRRVLLLPQAGSLGPVAEKLGLEVSWSALATAWILGQYAFDAYKPAPAGEAGRRAGPCGLEVDASGGSAERRRNLAAVLREAVVVGGAINTIRELANTPPNDLYPEKLAAKAARLSRQRGLRVKVLRGKELARQRMGALLAVGAGSARRPCLVQIEYAPRRSSRQTLVLVGKAITFDSGGLSIKPARGMEEMKFDMSGGAAVLGALLAIARLKPSLRVIGLIPSAENVIGESAMRPGDIVRTASGKTVEILNTDAEGRLILADALHYARRFRPTRIVDLATLTGACLIALGTQISGLVSNDRDFARLVFEAGERSGERLWELPLYDEFHEAVKSPVADLRNSAGRNGGTITAAAFLAAFVQGVPWCHLDIAGTAWTDREAGPHAVGATGVGVRVVLEVVRALASRPRGIS